MTPTLCCRARFERISSIAAASPKPFSTMFAPAAASSVAMPSPMPLVDPVTSAVLPEIPMMSPQENSRVGLVRR
jgi:hypothetical protein